MPPEEAAAQAASEQSPTPQDAPAAPVEGAPAPASAPDAKPAAPATDWRDGLDGDALEIAKRHTTPQDLAKSQAELRKSLSTMIKVPGKDAKPEDVEKFKKTIGAPVKAEEYKFDPPEQGLELTDTQKAMQSEVAKILYEGNAPAWMSEKLQAKMREFALAQAAEDNRVALKVREDSEAGLKKKWGADYEATDQMGQRAAHVFGPVGFKEFLNDTIVSGGKLGDHPMMREFCGTVGRRMGEGQFIGAVGAGDRQTLQERQAALMRAHPPGSESYKDPAVQREMREISEKLYGTETIGGRGRA